MCIIYTNNMWIIYNTMERLIMISLLLIGAQHIAGLTISEPPSDVTTSNQGNFTLICQVSGYNAATDTITWTMDVTGGPAETIYQVSPAKRTPSYDTSKYSIDQFNLQVLKTDFSDGTVYHCIADVQVEANVVILGTPVITAVTGVEGDLIFVECVAEFGSPPLNHLVNGQQPRIELFIDDRFQPANLSVEMGVDHNDPMQGSMHAKMNYTAYGGHHGKAVTCRVYTALPSYEVLGQTIIQVQFSVRNLSVMHMRHINDTRDIPEGHPSPGGSPGDGHDKPPPPPVTKPPTTTLPPTTTKKEKMSLEEFLRRNHPRGKRGVEGAYPRSFGVEGPNPRAFETYPGSDMPVKLYDVHSADLTPTGWGEHLGEFVNDYKIGLPFTFTSFLRRYIYGNTTEEWRGYQLKNSSSNGTVVLPGHKLSCVAEGNPRPDIMWEPISSPVVSAVSGPDLDITQEFMGSNLWKCIASNTVNQLSSQEHYVAFEVVDGAASRLAHHWVLMMTSLLIVLLHSCLRHA